MLLHNVRKFDARLYARETMIFIFTFLQAFGVSEDRRMRLHGFLHSQSQFRGRNGTVSVSDPV